MRPRLLGLPGRFAHGSLRLAIEQGERRLKTESRRLPFLSLCDCVASNCWRLLELQPIVPARRLVQHRGAPRLEESGYQVSHALVEIVGDTIIASGWDGSSRAVSEGGDAYWLMCDGCGKLHPLPPELHIDWR
jgi:hypothetical protein